MNNGRMGDEWLLTSQSKKETFEEDSVLTEKMQTLIL